MGLTARNLKGLFLAHGRELEEYLSRRVRCAHTAADLTQEAFLRLAQQPVEAGAANARAYLYRIARNLAIDHFRQDERRQTRPVPAEDLAGMPDEAPPVERATASRQRLALLLRAVAELPPRTQEIFVLNRVEGLTHVEVARRLGISESSVQKHLARALGHAMQRLKNL